MPPTEKKTTKEIFGIVLTVNKISKSTEPLNLEIRLANDTIKYYIYHPIFRPELLLQKKLTNRDLNPIHVGDCIHGIVNAKHEFVQKPFIQVPVNEDSVKECFIKALTGTGFGRVSADNLYNKLTCGALASGYFTVEKKEKKETVDDIMFKLQGIPKASKKNINPDKDEEENTSGKNKDIKKIKEERTCSPANIISYLTELSLTYKNTQSKDIIDGLCTETNLKHKQIINLLVWWYQNRLYRRLILFGLTEEMIIKSGKDPEELYELCCKNPFIIPSIPKDVATNIMLSMKKDIDSDEVYCGDIVRQIYDNLNNRAWTYTPKWMIVKNFPNFYKYKKRLVDEYECVITEDELYLAYPYKVETYVCDYLDKKIKETAKECKNGTQKIGRGEVEKPKLLLKSGKMPFVTQVKTPFKEIDWDEDQEEDEGKAPFEKDDDEEAKSSFSKIFGNARKEKEKDIYVDGHVFKEDGHMKKMDKLIEEDSEEMETPVYIMKTLTDEQKLAIQGCLMHRISVLTGIPGSGKTTTIKEIVHNLDVRKVPYVIASFTGKAVSRINEVLGKKIAITMDRAISRTVNNPKFKFLLIDESSMVTTELFYRFITKYKHDYKIIVIGDIQQLQPIGWGSFMKHLILSRRVPTYSLTVNHRLIEHTTETSDNFDLEGKAPGEVKFDRIVLRNLTKMVDPVRLKNLTTPLIFEKGEGFYEYEGDIKTVKALVQSLKDADIELKRVCVLTPYNENIEEINIIMQNIYLKGNKYVVDKFNKIWYVGDRVMLTENNYDINVYNGDEGYVTDVTPKGIEVQFSDGMKHFFSFNDDKKYGGHKSWTKNNDGDMGLAVDEDDEDGDGKLDENEKLTTKSITHSFCITIDKSQGSEVEFCIIYIPKKYSKFPSKFLCIERMYTGISRTKRACWIVGDLQTLRNSTMIKQPDKYDMMGYRLIKIKNIENEMCLEIFIKAPEIVVKIGGGKISMESFEENDDYNSDDF